MLNTFAYSGVDAIQSAKKQFVETFGPTEQAKKIAIDFVDAQTQYTKSAIDAGIKAITSTAELLTDRTPYIEAAKAFQAWFPMAGCATPSKKAK